jgi:hypothetical protein
MPAREAQGPLIGVRPQKELDLNCKDFFRNGGKLPFSVGSPPGLEAAETRESR